VRQRVKGEGEGERERDEGGGGGRTKEDEGPIAASWGTYLVANMSGTCASIPKKACRERMWKGMEMMISCRAADSAKTRNVEMDLDTPARVRG
jgi:hypothetical protein